MFAGPQSTLSRRPTAMTSVVQVFTTHREAHPSTELRFGADGGNLDTANGYASLAGANAAASITTSSATSSTPWGGVRTMITQLIARAETSV